MPVAYWPKGGRSISNFSLLKINENETVLYFNFENLLECFSVESLWDGRQQSSSITSGIVSRRGASMFHTITDHLRIVQQL